MNKGLVNFIYDAYFYMIMIFHKQNQSFSFIPATREAAFVEALSFAALAFQRGQECVSRTECSCQSQGQIMYNHMRKVSFPRCANAMIQGVHFAEGFVRGAYKVKSKNMDVVLRSQLKLHNHAVGRQVRINR